MRGRGGERLGRAIVAARISRISRISRRISTRKTGVVQGLELGGRASWALGMGLFWAGAGHAEVLAQLLDRRCQAILGQG